MREMVKEFPSVFSLLNDDAVVFSNQDDLGSVELKAKERLVAEIMKSQSRLFSGFKNDEDTSPNRNEAPKPLGNIPLGPTGKSPPEGINRPLLAGASHPNPTGANHPPTLVSSLDSDAARRFHKDLERIATTIPQMRASKNPVHACHPQHTINYYAKSRAEHIKTYYNGIPSDDFIAKSPENI